MVKDDKEPERVTLQVSQRILTAQSQAKQVSFNAQLALHPLLDASLHQVTGYCHLAASHPSTAASSEADRCPGEMTPTPCNISTVVLCMTDTCWHILHCLVPVHIA